MFTGEARPSRGFTLLELGIVIAIIAIFSVLVLGGWGTMQSRARRAGCMQNLKTLYIGTDLYLQQNNEWPQISVDPSSEGGTEQFALAWISALQPFGVTAKEWICPEIQQLIGNPDYSQPDNARLDYIPMPFDNKPTTPHEWSSQPWFIERGNAHGKGNLIIFTDGHIVAADELNNP